MAALWLPSDDRHTLALREPNLLVPGQKPVGNISVNKSNPLAKGLRFCFPMTPNLGRVTNICEKSPAINAPLGSGWSWSSRHGQIGLETTGASTISLGSSINDLLLSANEVSLFFIAQTDHTTTDSRLMGSIGTSNSFDRTLYIWYDTDGANDSWAASFIALNMETSGVNDSGYVASRPQAVGFSVKYRQFQKIYLDGGLVSTSTITATLVPKAYTSTVPFLLGGIQTLTPNFDGVIYYLAIWDRALSDAEQRSLGLNPYQLLKPANDTPYLISVPTGGATVTLSSPTATATGSTTATVGCTVTYT